MEKVVSRLYCNRLVVVLTFISLLMGCRKIDIVYYDPNTVEGEGLYVLCEGNMGSNRAQVDFLSYAHDTLFNNVYPSVNPKVVRELGDVGNDIAAYGGKLYMVINCSGKVEVTDRNLRRITQIDIPNCRSICFSGAYAYVSSYAGPVEMGNRQIGYVAKVDTATLRVVATCNVGYQPNGIAAYGGKIYVANSGGYLAPDYDSTVSVIDETTFSEVYRIPVAKNLDALCLDTLHNALFVSSIGDYSKLAPALYRIDLSTEQVTKMGFHATKMCLVGELLYYYSDAYGAHTEIPFGVLHTGTLETRPLVLPEQVNIRVPYGIFVDADRRMLYIADSPLYTNPGYLYCFRFSDAEGEGDKDGDGEGDKDGDGDKGGEGDKAGDRNAFVLHKVFRTGDIPGHFCLK